MKTIIKKLRKGDEFIFNDKTHLVTKRYIDDDHPLIATTDNGFSKHLFHFDGLEVEQIK